jgi:hypothetical protein
MNIKAAAAAVAKVLATTNLQLTPQVELPTQVVVYLVR